MENFEMKCLQEVAKLRKENNAMKQIICVLLEDEGRSGNKNYCGIGLFSIGEIEKRISNIAKNLPTCGTKYVVNGVDELEGTTFSNFECFGTTLIDIAGLHQDRHGNGDNWIHGFDSKTAMDYLGKHGFEVSITW